MWMKGPSLPAMSPPAMEHVTPTSLHTSVFRLSSPARHFIYISHLLSCASVIPPCPRARTLWNCKYCSCRGLRAQPFDLKCMRHALLWAGMVSDPSKQHKGRTSRAKLIHLACRARYIKRGLGLPLIWTPFRYVLISGMPLPAARGAPKDTRAPEMPAHMLAHQAASPQSEPSETHPHTRLGWGSSSEW